MLLLSVSVLTVLKVELQERVLLPVGSLLDLVLHRSLLDGGDGVDERSGYTIQAR